MIFSKPVIYACRALIFLSSQRGNGPILSSTIAANTMIPPAYLVKILGDLTVAKIVTSTRGPGGGFAMIKNPKQTTLQEVVSVFEGYHMEQRCPLCAIVGDNEVPCGIHDKWRETRQAVLRFLNETTVADLMAATPQPNEIEGARP